MISGEEDDSTDRFIRLFGKHLVDQSEDNKDDDVGTRHKIVMLCHLIREPRVFEVFLEYCSCHEHL